MKKIITLTTILITFLSFAQVPQGISYQAIALNNSGNPVVSSNVGIRLSILDNSATGTVLYTETHTKTTNAQGLFNLVIGQGTGTSGTFSTINWGVNTKFLKVEMDIAGGTNYVLVGSTQLISVPYALAADSLVTSPGEGITLVSPNGTPYQLTVNNNGQLSLPTSSQPSNTPTQLYLYGSFNGWDAANALQFGNYYQYLIGYKYFTAGTQIKFLAAQNTNVVYGGNGNNTNGQLTLNGAPITIPSNGFYKITVDNSNYYSVTSINVLLNQNYSTDTTMQYNVANNYFYGASAYGEIKFKVDGASYGDNLADGIAEVDGATIIANQGSTYNYKFYLNFNGSANYTSTLLSSNLYLFGAFQSWNTATSIAMTNTLPGVFQITRNFTAATEIKFIPQQNWNVNYGGANGVLISNGANIAIPSSGTYTITVNLSNMTYTIN